MRTYIGVIGFDSGGHNLTSRETRNMSFEDAAKWFTASVEYFSVAIEYDYSVSEIVVNLYDASTRNRVDAEPVASKLFHR